MAVSLELEGYRREVRLAPFFSIVGLAMVLAAAAEPRAGVVTTLGGRADLARAEQVRLLRFDDDLFGRDRIDTSEHSLVRVLLGGKGNRHGAGAVDSHDRGRTPTGHHRPE